MTITLNGTTGITTPDVTSDGLTVDSTTLVVDEANNRVGVGTSSPAKQLHIESSTGGTIRLSSSDTTVGAGESLGEIDWYSNDASSGGSGVRAFVNVVENDGGLGRAYAMTFGTGNVGTASERARIDSSGNLLVGQTTATVNSDGAYLSDSGCGFARTSGDVITINRLGTDGGLVSLRQAGTQEGLISVSGTTVTYGGGHLARFTQLPNSNKDESLLKGTVLSNLDEMIVYVNKETGETVSNEQLNKTKVSDIEGDPNVAGVFVSWQYDEAHDVQEFFVAMTGDMVIRIAQGTTVQRGDLLMSAGDGTAKPQGDDIVRSKTIAKVTSTNVTCTYADGSYCVPCVLMAC